MKSVRILLEETKIIDEVYKRYYVNAEEFNPITNEWEVIRETITVGLETFEHAVEIAKYLLTKYETTNT